MLHKTLSKQQQEWLDWLAEGGIIERSATTDPIAVGSTKKVYWRVIDALEAAGLARWTGWQPAAGVGHSTRFVLTDTGRLFASQKENP